MYMASICKWPFTLGSCSSWSRLLWEPFLCLEASVSTVDSSPETPELPSHDRPPERFTPAAHRTCDKISEADSRPNSHRLRLHKCKCIFLTKLLILIRSSFFTFIEASFCSSGLRHTGTGRFILFSAWPPLATYKEQDINNNFIKSRKCGINKI